MNADADVVIVGGGMAGLSAGIWAGRLGLKSKIIEKDERAGGQLHWIQDVIPDYPGLELRGTDFARTLCDQAQRSASIETGIAVQKILPFQDAPEAGDLYVLETTGGILSARAVLISTGLRRRTLPAVRAFHGTGIYYTSQPRDQFKGNSLVIAGGGDGAVENAILLQAQWKKIYIVHPDDATLDEQFSFEDKANGMTFLPDGNLVIAGTDVTVVDPDNGRTIRR
ncbi:MAG TPA: NAD(P)/FAD-dependent oxidoreductase, partial [Leptospiraceae bacterium]|nr:NAD(P)/FAD-dependent oxidoreductase [Leptospiraceae bacterium]